MSRYFTQECPVCGRPLHVHLAHDGRRVRCQHCRGCFVAQRQIYVSGRVAAGVHQLIRRANQLLAMSAQQRNSIDCVRTAARANVPTGRDFHRYETIARGQVTGEVLCQNR